MSVDEMLSTLKAAVVAGDDAAAVAAAQALLASPAEPIEIIRLAISPAMDDVGIAFENGDAFLPELMLAGDAARAALDLIVPKISAADRSAAIKGKIVIGTIFGDNHDIGKNLVIALMAAYGLKVIDLGINVPVRNYIEAAIKEEADIIAISSLITTSLPYQRELIKVLGERGLRDKFFVIVGGGPVRPEWAVEIGADGYGRDAKNAAALCVQLLEGLSQGEGAPLAEPILIGALQHG